MTPPLLKHILTADLIVLPVRPIFDSALSTHDLN